MIEPTSTDPRLFIRHRGLARVIEVCMAALCGQAIVLAVISYKVGRFNNMIDAMSFVAILIVLIVSNRLLAKCIATNQSLVETNDTLIDTNKALLEENQRLSLALTNKMMAQFVEVIHQPEQSKLWH